MTPLQAFQARMSMHDAAAGLPGAHIYAGTRPGSRHAAPDIPLWQPPTDPPRSESSGISRLGLEGAVGPGLGAAMLMHMGQVTVWTPSPHLVMPKLASHVAGGSAF